jgi:hypothetical protein
MLIRCPALFLCEAVAPLIEQLRRSVHPLTFEFHRYSMPLCAAVAPLIELLKRPVERVAGVDDATAAAAQKNAAIALARLAKYEAHATKLRELRGMEILMANAHKFRE